MKKEKILSELYKIGFTDYKHLRKEKRDGKQRFTWTHPVNKNNEWFTVLLVDEGGEIFIENLTNPLGVSFDKKNIEGLIEYIKTQLLFRKSE